MGLFDRTSATQVITIQLIEFNYLQIVLTFHCIAVGFAVIMKEICTQISLKFFDQSVYNTFVNLIYIKQNALNLDLT